MINIDITVNYGYQTRIFTASPKSNGDPVNLASKTMFWLAGDARKWLHNEKDTDNAPVEVKAEVKVDKQRRVFTASDTNASINIAQALVGVVRDDATAWLQGLKSSTPAVNTR